MHRALAVSFPVSRSRWQLWVMGVFLGLSIAGSVALVFLGSISDDRLALMVVVLGVAAAVAGAEWWRTPQGVLRWDGNQWSWETGSEPVPCAVRLVLDCQKVIVLRLQFGQRASRYHWIEATSAPMCWQALRRALVSHARHPLALAEYGTQSSTVRGGYERR